MNSGIRTLGLIGADGRMGQAVERAVEQAAKHANTGRYRIAARITADTADYADLALCDAVIDFSAPDAVLSALPHLGEATVLVSGTTGLTSDQDHELLKASQTRAILRSGNFSLGIAVLSALAERAAASLGEGWDVEVLEMHHRHKADAPSGTALMLGEAAARGRNVALDTVAVHDRSGARRPGDIGFAVLRGGGVYGDHEVRIVSESEHITLGHRALNRQVFADGALAATDWLLDQSPGLYGMHDLISV